MNRVVHSNASAYHRRRPPPIAVAARKTTGVLFFIGSSLPVRRAAVTRLRYVVGPAAVVSTSVPALSVVRGVSRRDAIVGTVRLGDSDVVAERLDPQSEVGELPRRRCLDDLKFDEPAVRWCGGAVDGCTHTEEVGCDVDEDFV